MFKIKYYNISVQPTYFSMGYPVHLLTAYYTSYIIVNTTYTYINTMCINMYIIYKFNIAHNIMQTFETCYKRNKKISPLADNVFFCNKMSIKRYVLEVRRQKFVFISRKEMAKKTVYQTRPSPLPF